MNLRKTSQTLAAITALATLTVFAGSAEANSIFRVRAGAAVLRGHSQALANFLKSQCRVVPQLGVAHASANHLAAHTDRFWDMTRCQTPLAELKAQLCEIQEDYEQTDRAVRRAMRHGPQHQFAPACQLLELIEKQICRIRENMARLAPAPLPVHAVSHRYGNQFGSIAQRPVASPWGHSSSQLVLRPAWAQPAPAVICNSRGCSQPCTNRACRIHHPAPQVVPRHPVGRWQQGSGINVRIGGLRFSF